jgi:glycine/D-amino acid oxidase-like deaminating enzyme
MWCRRRHEMGRLIVFFQLLFGLRRHDFRAARTWIQAMYTEQALPVRIIRFMSWALELMWIRVYRTRRWATFARPVSRVPIWLVHGNPFENYPFRDRPDAALPEQTSVVVIGAGLIGGALAYHWSKLGAGVMTVVEACEVAGGAAGRNEGLVVMGRYYYYVHKTVLAYLDRSRQDLSAGDGDRLAHEFAAAYVRAAYANAEMIAETVEKEGIDCDYVRRGWVQVPGPAGVHMLDESARMAQETGFKDWIKIQPEQVFAHAGLKTSRPAGFSIAAATWHPARWVWGLMRIALASGRVELFTRTKVLKVQNRGDRYAVHTERGVILADYVVNATESQTPQLFPEFHNVICPMQTQAAFGESDGGSMKAGVGISSDRAFYGKHANGVIFGSDATRVPDHEAGGNRPSRFITSFVLTEMKQQFQVGAMNVKNEWSGTVSYTPDEYPIVGSMDGKRMYIIAGMAGSGSGVSFNAARHVVQKITGAEGPDYYPERYFSPARFQSRMTPLPVTQHPASTV